MISAPLFWFDKKGHCHFNPMVPPLFAWEIRMCARNVYFIATKVTSRASPQQKKTPTKLLRQWKKDTNKG